MRQSAARLRLKSVTRRCPSQCSLSLLRPETSSPFSPFALVHRSTLSLCASKKAYRTWIGMGQDLATTCHKLKRFTFGSKVHVGRSNRGSQQKWQLQPLLILLISLECLAITLYTLYLSYIYIHYIVNIEYSGETRDNSHLVNSRLRQWSWWQE